MNYYVKTLNGEGGPLGIEQMHELVRKGYLTPQHFIRREDSNEWILAESVEGLFANQSVLPQVERMNPYQSRTLHGGASDIPPALLPTQQAVIKKLNDSN